MNNHIYGSNVPQKPHFGGLNRHLKPNMWKMTAAILKIDMSPYLSEKSSDFHEILYTATDFEVDERHMIKNKVALNRLQV